MTQLNAKHTALLPVASCLPPLYCSNKKKETSLSSSRSLALGMLIRVGNRHTKQQSLCSSDLLLFSPIETNLLLYVTAL